MIIDTSSAFGRRADKRLRSEIVAWFTSIDRAGTPQPIPVWFLWDGESVLVYSQPETAKLRNIAQNPRVALHLDGNGRGGDVVVITGDARADPNHLPASEVTEYLAKYEDDIKRIGYPKPDLFAADYSVPIVITPRKLRGF